METTPMGWMSDQDYQFIYSKTPRLCVDIIPVTSYGVILSRRDIEPWRGLWHFPGGRVRYRESLANASLRIGLAELGVELGDLELMDYTEVIRDGSYVHSNSFVFAAQIVSGEVKGDYQSSEIGYFTKVPPLMLPSHAEVLERHLQKLLSRRNTLTLS